MAGRRKKKEGPIALAGADAEALLALPVKTEESLLSRLKDARLRAVLRHLKGEEFYAEPLVFAHKLDHAHCDVCWRALFAGEVAVKAGAFLGCLPCGKDVAREMGMKLAEPTVGEIPA